jgi:PIN domain nuclease of toxin-antitoxin system
MKILIDTHAFLWFVNGSSQLSTDAKSLLESEVDLLLSVASLWEIAIKTSLGKLTLPGVYGQFIPQQILQNEIEVLPISLKHLTVIATLAFRHRDPFDRLLIAQAMVEQVSIVSIDAVFDSYSIDRIW